MESYNLINGRVGFENFNGRWGVFLWGKNLTDELYMLEKAILPIGAPYAWYAIPRTYGIQLRYSFFK